MKILIYSDVHFSQYSSILRSRGEKFSTRLEGIIKSLNAVEEIAINEGIDLILSLGDFFDTASLNAEELSALREIKWAKLPHLFLVGNHELDTISLQKSSAHVLGLQDFSSIVDSIMRYETEKSVLYFLPYQFDCDSVNFDDIVKPEDYNKNRICFSHNDLKGINYGGYVSKAGLDLDNIERHFSLFLNGHLHNRERISKNIINVGNFTGQNFSEDAFKYEHCYMILDTDTMSFTSRRTPYCFNFYQIDFTEKNDIDFINSIKLYSNAVVSVKCTESNTYRLIRSRFDVNYSEDGIFKKDTNIIASRFTVNRKIDSNYKESVGVEPVDYLEKFRNFIYERVGNDVNVEEEVSEICR